MCVAILILAVQIISRLESLSKKKKNSISKTGQDLEGLHTCQTNESHTQLSIVIDRINRRKRIDLIHLVDYLIRMNLNFRIRAIKLGQVPCILRWKLIFKNPHRWFFMCFDGSVWQLAKAKPVATRTSLSKPWAFSFFSSRSSFTWEVFTLLVQF